LGAAAEATPAHRAVEVSHSAADLLEREARERRVPALAARRLVDFSGPLGIGACFLVPAADLLDDQPTTW
jgi:hypothetical protein